MTARRLTSCGAPAGQGQGVAGSLTDDDDDEEILAELAAEEKQRRNLDALAQMAAEIRRAERAGQAAGETYQRGTSPEEARGPA